MQKQSKLIYILLATITLIAFACGIPTASAPALPPSATAAQTAQGDAQPGLRPADGQAFESPVVTGEWEVAAGQPGNIAVGPDSEIYVTINNSHHVIRHGTSCQSSADWDLGGEPLDIAVTPGGQVYVTINNSHRIVGYGANGQILSEWTTNSQPGHIAVGADGKVYVTINNSHRVVGYGTDGQSAIEWDTDGEIGDIAAGAGGLVFVTINNSHRVVAYDVNGQRLSEWIVDGQPTFLAVGKGGEIYVTINNSHRVVAYSPVGQMLTEWLVDGEPNGIAVGPSGQVFVTVNNSHRVVEFSKGSMPISNVPGSVQSFAADCNSLTGTPPPTAASSLPPQTQQFIAPTLTKSPTLSPTIDVPSQPPQSKPEISEPWLEWNVEECRAYGVAYIYDPNGISWAKFEYNLNDQGWRSVWMKDEGGPMWHTWRSEVGVLVGDGFGTIIGTIEFRVRATNKQGNETITNPESITYYSCGG